MIQSNGSKTRILDAAEDVVLRDGVAHLTLDAVAAETQMSKGGVLYHFHSKDDLIRGMIRRMHEEFDEEVRRRIAEDACRTGRTVRALLNTTFSKEPSARTARMDRIAAGLLAAVATNRILLGDLKEYSQRIEREIANEGLDPVTAFVIHAAADGLWLSGLFGIAHPSGEMRELVIERLRVLSMGEEAPKQAVA
jgi:AcrR family transcriptional regulator